MLSLQVQEFGRPLAQVLRETPKPQGTEVLVKVNCCGLCHSDLHLHDGYFALGGDDKLDLRRSMPLPRTLGHEVAGTVVALGPEVHAGQGLRVGDRRIVFPWIGCGRCGLCQAGEEQLCAAPQVLGLQRDGGFADHMLVPHPRVLLEFDPLPEDEAATLACSGLTAYGALKKVPPLGAGDALLVIGAGGVGLAGIRLARRMLGVAPIVVELDKGKWDVAREAGAGELIDPSAEGALKSLIKATGGGVAAAVDFVGAAATFSFGLGALRKSGKLISVGLFGGSAPVLPVMLAMKAVTIAGSYVGSLAELHELMAIARAGGLPAMPLASRPLTEAMAAMDDLRAGRVKGRAILRP